MKFRIDKQDFLSGLATVSRALPTRAVSPILEGVLIEADATASRLRLLCTNTALQIETFIPADVSDSGVCVMQGKQLYEIVRLLDEGEVELATGSTQNAVTITSGKYHSNRKGFDADEFPEMPPILPKGSVTIAQSALRSMIGQTLFAVSTDEARPVLTGGLLETDEGGVLNAVAVDGYRLALRTEPCVADTDINAVVPAATLSAIEKSLFDEGDVTITFSPVAAMFDMEHTRITTVLIAGEYTKYKKIIPADKLTTVRVMRSDLLNAINRAVPIARDNKNNLIRLNIASDVLTVSANSELGDAREEVPISLVGGELEIAFNAKYMTDVLKAIDEDEVTMELNTSITPCVIRPTASNKWLYLVLPVRIFS